MPRFCFILFALFFSIAQGAAAQQALSDFRYIVSKDMDFYGSDLESLFDTDLSACVQACSAQASCQAFTFNARSNACFPKRGVSKQTPYEGAVSALKLATPAELQNLAQLRATDLGFLKPQDLEVARAQGRDLGLRHAAGGLDLETVLGAARASAGDAIRYMQWIGVAVSLSDRGDLWTEYASALLAIDARNSNRQREYRARALSAAVNGYLRAQNTGAQVSALQVLSEGLEQSSRGRDMVAALRLANTLQPQDDIARALEAAIAKYGFRVVDSTVESDSTAPRICAQFSEPLVKAGVDYEPFVNLPSSSLVVQVDGSQLCVDGAAHGSRYRILLRQGLPAASGEVLHKDVELTHYVRDRAPSVKFPGRSYVLPQSADAALPVQTVNLNEVELQLRRVSDRNLLRAVQDGYFGRPLNHWQDQNFASEIAQDVWSGTGEVQNALNQDMVTRLPMGEAIAGQPAGIYALTARVPGADPYDDPGATQWFVLSDLGISTMSGTDGLHVNVRGLGDALPKAGVEVTLVSRANAVLGKLSTDTEGYARFEPGLVRGDGSAAPAMVLATLDDTDLGFLSLTDPAFDLSDRGVEGRAPAGPVDVFLTTDRGAYRAGEVVHATVLTRDDTVTALEGVPLTAILSRPDGVEYRRLVSGGGNVGGHVFAFPVGSSVPRGAWRLDIKTDPNGKSVATQTVLVEDFLPERIDFTLSLPNAPLRPGESPPLQVQAKYLFGAPGSDLKIDGQVVLRAASQLAEWPGYQFGRHDESASAQSSYFGDQKTDSKGQAFVPAEIPRLSVVGKPLEATVIARLADGSSRPVERRLVAPVLPDTPVLGIKPLFDGVVTEGTEAAFEIIGLAPDLSPTPMQVRWTLNRVETRYQWYQLYGNWNWEPVTRRTRIATGEATLQGQPVSVSSPVDWGTYELVVERLDEGYVATSAEFYAGWYQAADASATPDRLELSLDQDSYQPGDTATLRIVPRAAGTALVTVMSNKVIHRQSVEVPAGASVIPLEVTEEWGAGAYVTASVIRPMDVSAGQNPTRALGLAHATVDPIGKRLAVSVEVPEVAQPRQTQQAKVTVSGAAAGEQVWMTLAAVDVGILNLTGFESPDPDGHYFGQRRLGVELRDVYGRLIDGLNGAVGSVRSGGDANAGMRAQSPPPTQDLMARFSGPVEVGADGTATVDIDLPAFNGTVRLMVVAWSKTAVGQAEQDMIVRDPVVVTASLPRFLAPGDDSQILLEIVHADGPAGDMTLTLNADSTLQLATQPGGFTLETGGKTMFRVPVKAVQSGLGNIDVVLTTPDDRVSRQTLRLPVQSNDPVVAQTRRFTLGAGDSFLFSQDVFTGLRAGSAQATLSAGALARFDAPGLLTALDRYPYGCTEQVTSQAMPLLYLSSVAQAAGLGDGPAVRARIDASIARVLTRQASNGAFGLWRAESGDFWLDAYASDFLSRARTEGHVVPDRAFTQAMDNLRNRINYAPDFDIGGEDIAYALMVLAREGAAAMGDLRYYADVKGDGFATPLAAAQLGAALASYGDQTRADRMFSRAAQLIDRQQGHEGPFWRADYGTSVRDSAGVLALAVEAGSAVVDRNRLITQISQETETMSTQESAWTLLAAQALVKSPETSGLMVNGSPVEGPFVQILSGATQEAMNITAAGGGSQDITLTTLGVPTVAPPAGGTGYSIQRQYFSMDGDEINGPSFVVGDRFVAVVTVQPFEDSGARLMVRDPLPAGFEIDNPSLLRSGDVRALEWLNLSDATHSEFRSNSFLAAVDIGGRDPVTLAYVVRAVSAGQFHHPAASVEDMYRPRFRARTDTSRVTVQD